ncbi:MAG: YdcF family protein [Gammaproteobacteria bacterium]|nr:YdcF family protein [Gammaproteobacteria bacterium]
MLAKHNNKIDIDGYSMFALSGLVMIATAGISYLFCFKKIFQTANKTTHDCEENVVLCVLGKKLINNKPDNEYLLRLHRASHILNIDEQSQAILLGGKTGKANISEAFAGKEFLLSNNIKASRINLEESSINTLENIKNAIALVSDKDKKIVVVTNRYHLARVKQTSEGFGLDVVLCAAEDKLKLDFVTLFKLMIEALHVHWYLSGHYYAHLTNNKRIINRLG